MKEPNKNMKQFLKEIKKDNFLNNKIYKRLKRINKNTINIDDIINIFVDEKNVWKINKFYKLMDKYNIKFNWKEKEVKLWEVSLYKNNITDKLRDINIEDIYKFDNININTFLNRDKEKRIFEQYKNSWLAVKKIIEEEILLSYKYMILSIANKYNFFWVEKNDLIMNGYIGLLLAIRKFDTKYNVRFITYWIWWIKYYIMKTITEYKNVVKIPYYFLSENKKINDIYNNILQEKLEKWRTLDKNSIRKIKKKVSDFKAIETRNTIFKWWYSLDKKVNDEDWKSDTFWDIIKSDILIPSEEHNKEYIKKIINDILKQYSQKEREIIQLRYWINWFKRYKLKDIAKKYNLTTERIRQIIKKVIRHIKDNNWELFN